LKNNGWRLTKYLVFGVFMTIKFRVTHDNYFPTNFTPMLIGLISVLGLCLT
jgi:hypothetical protein